MKYINLTPCQHPESTDCHTWVAIKDTGEITYFTTLELDSLFNLYKEACKNDEC